MDYTRLSIGQMASLNCISDKALRFYHDKGLLVPQCIDDTNGRRFYSLEQCYALDFIQQLQLSGMSLETIKSILDNGDSELLQSQLDACVEDLEHQRFVLEMELAASREMANDLRFFSSCDLANPMVEITEFKEQRIWEFHFDDPVFHPIPSLSYDEAASVWREALRSVKQSIMNELENVSEEIPLPLLFRNVGSMYRFDESISSGLVFCGAFVQVPPLLWDKLPVDLTVLPAGNYLTITGDDIEASCAEERITIGCIRRLATFAQEHDCAAADVCLVESPSDLPAFLAGTAEKLFRARLLIA